MVIDINYTSKINSFTGINNINLILKITFFDVATNGIISTVELNEKLTGSSEKEVILSHINNKSAYIANILSQDYNNFKKEE